MHWSRRRGCNKAPPASDLSHRRALNDHRQHRLIPLLSHTHLPHSQGVSRISGPGWLSGTALNSSVTDLTPDIDSSDKPDPGPQPSLGRRSRQRLDTKGCHERSSVQFNLWPELPLGLSQWEWCAQAVAIMVRRSAVVLFGHKPFHNRPISR